MIFRHPKPSKFLNGKALESFELNRQYYQLSPENYTISKNAGQYFCANPDKEFIGGPFSCIDDAIKCCDEDLERELAK